MFADCFPSKKTLFNYWHFKFGPVNVVSHLSSVNSNKVQSQNKRLSDPVGHLHVFAHAYDRSQPSYACYWSYYNSVSWLPFIYLSIA